MLVLLRLISLILVVSALMLLGADAVASLEKGVVTVRSVADVWMLFSKTGDAHFVAWCTAHLPGFLSHFVLVLLGCWSWAVVGFPGIVLAFLFGRRVADAGH
jgi:hypothetical protein